ncbi:peptidoglycan-binding domain-containing protein [Streptomyces sp. NRRL F-5650]|uniref:peptidoglycan-binding domain-containing protein n=1 Tax=Streptomyces sp. NRRL F-5650 TaxID=1463868 RepID=UPI0004C95C34|nr:peptidoglycan-binding domain-containing protein [Streptomyces sp. NRRL F-5650]
MRASTRALVSVGTAAGIAVGSLAVAGTATAAPAPARQQTVSAGAVSVLAVNNLGLDTRHAKNWQCWLKYKGYNPGSIDGQLGTTSWKAAQRMFATHWGYPKNQIDGAVGPNTIRALQRYLNDYTDENLAVDGVAGPDTRAAFWNYTSVC